MRTCYFRSIIPLQLQSFPPSASQLISYWSAVTALHPRCIRHYLLSQYTAYWAPLLAHEDYHHINNTQLSSIAANLGWPQEALSLKMWLK